ncbi:hypothetical protein [Methylomicrobium sp. Wu6]|uniref:hypothetical protein n=1 Tax=Methylomicrobium sp. Wu6 TaxID=3107928 RepID=UPI002DD67AE6|nr:hypothetical protein [Methylomicrobium sp. Wu6]
MLAQQQILPYHPAEETRKPKDELGIKMEIPENPYNFDALYNQTVQKGSLTAEDRYKIEHIMKRSMAKAIRASHFPQNCRYLLESWQSRIHLKRRHQPITPVNGRINCRCL